MRIAHVANFYGPRSGGIRTAMHALAREYRARGHDPVLVVPGPEDGVSWRSGTPVVTLHAPLVPFLGGYRAILRPDGVGRLLDQLAPDRLEVSDRTTLTGLGDWAREAGVPSVLWLHERVDGVLRTAGPGWGTARVTPYVGRCHGAAADAYNARTFRRFDRLVATTAFAAGEAERLGCPPAAAAEAEPAARAAPVSSRAFALDSSAQALDSSSTTRSDGGARRPLPPLHRVPLGVDLHAFGPGRRSLALRDELALRREAVVLVVSRLSREKRVDLAVDAVARLIADGRPARLVVAGDGPLAAVLEERARCRGVPAAFLSFVGDRERLAALLATADVVVAAGPVETFGLAALEALASGTPVVASMTSALPEVVGPAGSIAAPTPDALALALHEVFDRPVGARRAAARDRAELFPWSTTAESMLALHGAPAAARDGFRPEREPVPA